MPCSSVNAEVSLISSSKCLDAEINECNIGGMREEENVTFVTALFRNQNKMQIPETPNGNMLTLLQGKTPVI